MIDNMKEKFKSLKFKNILGIVLGCTILVLCITLYQTYSKFRLASSGTVIANTSGLICDVALDTNAEYVENDEAYFLINIKNYTDTLTNDVEMGYTLTVTNNSGSNGLFRYVDSDSVTNNEYVATLNIPEHTFSTTKETETIKVYVKSSNNSSETVNFTVKLDAYQKTS